MLKVFFDTDNIGMITDMLFPYLKTPAYPPCKARRKN